MSVAGYNVIPDENDDHAVGIEIETTGPNLGQAVLYIDQEEIHLDYRELCTLIGQAKFVRLEMEWGMSSYVHASDRATVKSHLVHRNNAPLERSTFTIEPIACKYEKSLCGRPAPTWLTLAEPKGWDLEPVLGDPYHRNICKKCYAVWQKEQHSSERTQ